MLVQKHKQTNPDTLCWEANWSSQHTQQYGGSSNGKENCPMSQLKHPWVPKSAQHRDTCISVLTATLFTIPVVESI